MPNWKKVVVSGSSAELAGLTLSGLSEQGSENTALMITGSNVVGTRELGSLAFSSETYDNYEKWVLADDGQATTLNVTSGLSLNIVGGSNVTSVLSGTGGNRTLTISATDTNTTYSAGNGITLSGTNEFSLNTGSTHFTDGVKSKLNTESVVSGSAEGDSQGQIKLNGVNVNINGLGTDDSPTFTNLTTTGNTTLGNASSDTLTIKSTQLNLADGITSDATRGKIKFNTYQDDPALAGSVTLIGPSQAGGLAYTITLPAATGTLLTTGGSPSFTNITATGNLTVEGNTTLGNEQTDTILIKSKQLQLADGLTANDDRAEIKFNTHNDTDGGSVILRSPSGVGGLEYILILPAKNGTILTTADTGSGNGLDADKVDGLQAAQFLRSDVDSVFNDSGEEINFRVESNNNENMLFVSGSTNRVGIGTSLPAYTLDVNGDVGINQYLRHNDDQDTYINFQPDEITLQVGGEELINITGDSGGIVKLGDGGTVDVNLNDNLKVLGSTGDTELAADKKLIFQVSTDPPIDGFISGSNYAGQFQFDFSGRVYVDGTLSKNAGSFRIPHPDPNKPDKELWHSFVESPTAGDNIYRWKVETVSGSCDIQLPDYYRYLNENDQVWVSPVKHFGQAYGEVNEEQTILTIHSNQDGLYNVLLIGTRKDEIAKNHWKGTERDK